MKQKFILILILLFKVPLIYAQIDAPVCGHAATLADLLRKDYNAIDPESRQDEIIKDRSTVIAILKSYLTDKQKNDLQAPEFAQNAINAKQSFTDYDNLKKELQSYLGMSESMKDSANVLSIATKISGLTSRLKTTKDIYYKNSFIAYSTEIDAIKAAYGKENNYLDTICIVFKDKYGWLDKDEIDKLASSNPSSAIQKSIPFIGGSLTFETFIDGLSRFLAKRIKEELTTYVIDRVKKWLNNNSPDDPLAEFKVLLPRTCSYLSGFKADQVTNFTNEIKQYIEDDLSHIINNAANLRTTPRISSFIKLHPDIDFAFEALELIPALSKIKYPTDYFTFLENSKNISRWRNDSTDIVRYNIANTIYLTSLLTRSLVVIDNGEPRFAGVDFLTSYIREDKFFKAYMGILRQQNLKYYKVGFKFKHVVWVEDKLKDMFSNFANFENNKNLIKTIITDASRNAEKIFSIATDIRKANKAGKKIGADTVFNFIENIIQFSEEIAFAADTLMYTISDTISANRAHLFELDKIKPYFSLAKTTNELIYDIHQKKYATAIIKFIEAAPSLLQNEQLIAHTAIEKLLLVTFDESPVKWHTLFKEINTNDTSTFRIGSSFKSGARLIANELNGIELYSIAHSNDTAMLRSIRNLKKLCLFELQDRNNIQRSLLTPFQSLITDIGFKKIIVSYYTNLEIDTVFSKIKVELDSIKVPSLGNIPKPYFDSSTVSDFMRLIHTYATELYNSRMIRGNKSDDADLINAKKKLTSALLSYVSVLPQKFNVNLHPNLVLLIHFVNDMAVAKDAEDVEKAINAFALPAGSYSIKRSSRSNFSINSYPGILPALEITPNKQRNKRYTSVGFTAPIGISYSWSTRNGHSNGIFIPVFDIGAVTRLRLDSSSETKTLPEFSFKNLLSPGIFYSHGFSKTPFSLNIGLQYGPDLKEVKADGTTKSYESWRIGVGFVLDIPLFNIYSKPKQD